MERGRETSSLVELGGLRHLIPAFAEETVAKFGNLTEDFQRRRQGSFPSGAPGIGERKSGKRRSGQTRQSRERSFPHGGTEGSKPAPSSAESVANRDRGTAGRVHPSDHWQA